MTYKANVIPTIEQLESGELEPCSKMLRGSVRTYHFAPVYGLFVLMLLPVMQRLGFADAIPATPMGMVAYAIFQTLIMRRWAELHIRRHRLPSESQLLHLRKMAERDSAIRVALHKEDWSNFTFAQLQTFIAIHSARINNHDRRQAAAALTNSLQKR